jgi:hypothetical protein
MDINYFKSEVAHLLDGYELKYSSFKNGDFGDLERVEIEGKNKLGGVDFWSKGWVDIDVYDCILEEQILNFLLSPDELKKQDEAMKILIKVLVSDE